jgi:hypothetical protein
MYGVVKSQMIDVGLYDLTFSPALLRVFRRRTPTILTSRRTGMNLSGKVETPFPVIAQSDNYAKVSVADTVHTF